MAISILRDIDNRSAVGILARAAMSLTGDGNPEAEPVLAGEDELRKRLIAEARKLAHIPRGDDTEEALARIADIFDEESDRLIGKVDEHAALQRMAIEGTLPADLYEVQVAPPLQDFHGREFPLERDLIIETVRHPDQQQHFGPNPRPDQPTLVSLFGRFYRTRWPFKDFLMLVAGTRRGLIFDAFQAWRIYPSIMPIPSALIGDWSTSSSRNPDLVSLLNRFADEYGEEIDLDGRKGHFFLIADRATTRQATFPRARAGEMKVTNLTCFAEGGRDMQRDRVALLIAIDMVAYRGTLKKMAVDRKDFVDDKIAGRESKLRLSYPHVGGDFV